MNLVYKRKRYIFTCDEIENYVPERALFQLSLNKKYWFTTNVSNAYKLRKYADDDLRHKIEAEYRKKMISYRMSSSSESSLSIPCPEGLEYLPYQKAGIEFALRRKNTLIADEMGLGKTIQALGFINIRDLFLDRILIVCPASLKINWYRECKKWLITNHSIKILEEQKDMNHNILIINYSILYNYNLLDIDWDLLILDESHKIKSENSKRTRYIQCLKSYYKLFLTGTPILNRPIELWTTLNFLDPGQWGTRKHYSITFCGGHEGYMGWEEKGATNIKDFNKDLRGTIMLRRLKKDVLPQLPDKRRQIIEIPVKKLEKSLLNEFDLFNKYRTALDKLNELKNPKITTNIELYRNRIKHLKSEIDVSFYELAEIRKETSLLKLPYMIEHIDYSLQSINKLVVFGYHREILEELHNKYKNISMLMYGGMDIKKKQNAIDTFQNDSNCKLFIGSIPVSVGFTLTAASNIIFVEWDWVPANMKQAEDRCHRIGQKQAILIQYIVLENSVDVLMAKQLVKKDKIIENILEK